nr:MFS transporter [Roseococcus microcysteis]
MQNAPARSAKTILWVAIIGAAATSSLAMGIRQTYGLLLLPMSAEHAVAPWAFGLAVALHNLTWGLAQPVSGSMADKYGSGRVMAVGGVFYLIGCGLPALFPTNAMVLLGIGLFSGFGVACAGTGLALAAIGRLAPPRSGASILASPAPAARSGRRPWCPSPSAPSAGWVRRARWPCWR